MLNSAPAPISNKPLECFKTSKKSGTKISEGITSWRRSPSCGF
jgi:hypothetical protein